MAKTKKLTLKGLKKKTVQELKTAKLALNVVYENITSALDSIDAAILAGENDGIVDLSDLPVGNKKEKSTMTKAERKQLKKNFTAKA